MIELYVVNMKKNTLQYIKLIFQYKLLKFNKYYHLYTNLIIQENNS